MNENFSGSSRHGELDAAVARVLVHVRELVQQVGASCTPPEDPQHASLRREWGLDSLEIVELCSRLSADLDERWFVLDSAAALAHACSGVHYDPAVSAEPADPAQCLRSHIGSISAGRCLYIAYAAVVTALSAALLTLTSLVAPTAPRARAWAALVTRYTLRALGARLQLERAGAAASGGPVVYIANHASLSDVPALVSLLPSDMVFVAKREVIAQPVIGLVARKAENIIVDRADVHDCLRAAREIHAALQRGLSVLVFPEGTFVAEPGLNRFHLGAFSAAVAQQVPIVPVVLRGTRAFFPHGARAPRPTNIRVWLGQPLRAVGQGFDAAVSLRAKATQIIAGQLGERCSNRYVYPQSTRKRPHARRINLKRSVLHASFGVALAASIELFVDPGHRSLLRVGTLALAASAWLVELTRRHSASVNRITMAVFRHVAHQHEWTRVNSATWYVTAVWLLLSFEPARVSALALLVLAVADPVAGLIGRRFGTWKLRANRSAQGTLAFVLSAFIAVLAWQRFWLADIAIGSAICLAGSAALFGACAELFSGPLDDNLTIPIASALGIQLVEGLKFA